MKPPDKDYTRNCIRMIILTRYQASLTLTNSNIKEKLQSKNVTEVDIVTRAFKELLTFGRGRVSSRYLAIMVITLL